MLSIDDIAPGASVETALQAFRENVNRPPTTMFSTDHWLEPKLDELQTLLSDPITPDQAEALRDVLQNRELADSTRVWMHDVFEWLRTSGVPWLDFFVWRKAQAEKAYRERILSPIEVRWQRYLDYKKSLGDQWGAEHENPPEACPFCGKHLIVPVLYGSPSTEGLEAARRGEIVLGGCGSFFDDPNWFCRACDNWFDWRVVYKPDRSFSNDAD
jgi:hypothetical protein